MDTSLAIALIVLAFGAGYLLGKSGSSAGAVPPIAAPDLAALETVRPILAEEGMIAAIKAYREKTGAGLRDAKFAVESLQ